LTRQKYELLLSRGTLAVTGVKKKKKKKKKKIGLLNNMCFIVFKQFAKNNEIALRLVAMSVAGLLAYADDIVLLAPSWRG